MVPQKKSKISNEKNKNYKKVIFHRDTINYGGPMLDPAQSVLKSEISEC